MHQTVKGYETLDELESLKKELIDGFTRMNESLCWNALNIEWRMIVIQNIARVHNTIIGKQSELIIPKVTYHE